MKAFVANLQTEILKLFDVKQWRHVPGDRNPADHLTRGVMNPEELNSSNWFTGPDFLLADEDSWPNSAVQELGADDIEIRSRSVLVALGMAVEVERIDMSRFRSWLRLKRVVAWMVRFLTNCRRADNEDREAKVLSVDEINDAEHIIVKDVQATVFGQEIKVVSEGQVLPNSNVLSSLCPFVDDQGILRVGGRLSNLNIPMEMKHPPILARTHPATKLLIDWTHRRNGHVGTDHVLSIIRETYWVVGGRIAINQVVQRCFLCMIRRARKQFPYMADLP